MKQNAENGWRAYTAHRWKPFFCLLRIPSYHSIRYCVCTNIYIEIYWYCGKIIIIFSALLTIRINRTRKRVSVRTLYDLNLHLHCTQIHPSIDSPIRPFIAGCIITYVFWMHAFAPPSVYHQYYLSFTFNECGAIDFLLCMRKLEWKSKPVVIAISAK